MAHLGPIKTTDDNAAGKEPLVKRARRGKRLLSEAVQIEQEVVPDFVGTGVAVAALLVVAFLVWASFAKITETTIAPGEVVPSGNVKVVQHLEGGIVGDILVREGQLVDAGDVLLRLDAAQAGAELNQLESRAAALRLRAERLAAFGENRPANLTAEDVFAALVTDQREILRNQEQALASSLSVAESQIAQRTQRISQLQQSLAAALRQQELSGQLLAMRESLGSKRLVTQVDLLETRRAKATADAEVIRLREEIDVSRQELEEAQRRRADTETQARSESLVEMGRVRAELAEVENSLTRARNRVERLDVRAPVRGLVQDLQVQTSGQVIQPGALLMQVVPMDTALEAEVRISTSDVGHVTPGDPVLVKVSSYDFARFGGIDGTLRQISATSVLDDQGNPSYRAWVTLRQPHVGDDPTQHLVMPGMGVQAEIITGRKTLMSYLFKPINDAFERSFHER
ncbi:HlyD family type I secretion periplasmic adaptor subunit [Novispirillum sp. DQ9]|uniref:HlyD family type I secretion periplasmic adaptor subunit n=1 Tax=Novispirillum sp. DQ9 TaxID=3398612 RepID=UPI003C7E5A9A